MTRAPATEGGGLMLPLPGALRLRRFDGARSLNTGRAAGKRQQGDVAGPLDGHAQPPLVTRANARHAAGQNFAALLHELRKNVGALVVDEIHLIDAELANLLLAKILALATAQADGTSGATFATRTTVVRVTTLAARGASAFTTFPGGGSSRSGWPLFLFFGHNFLPFQCAIPKIDQKLGRSQCSATTAAPDSPARQPESGRCIAGGIKPQPH